MKHFKLNYKNDTNIFRFKSNYTLLDFSPSHNQVLIKSKRNKKDRNHNVDVIFKGVEYLFFPTSIKGIEISFLEPESYAKSIVKTYKIEDSVDYKNFVLKNSEGKEFVINAMSLGVYKNQLDILESSIGRYDLSNLE